MRNDALDEPEVVPSLINDEQGRSQPAPVVRPAPPAGAPPVRARTAPLWVLSGALLVAMAVLAWWSFQQIALLNQQLVATQETFATISEEAAGRIKDISGKVVATESSVTSESESLKLRVRQLENRLAELAKQQLNVSAEQKALARNLEQLTAGQKGHGDRLQQLDALPDGLKSTEGEVQAVAGKLKGLDADLAALKQQAQSVSRLEQDLLVLRSELDSRASQAGNSDFDAFRAQMTRSISELQGQIQTLQRQLDASR